ncbi:MAG: hypothetical protein JHC40_20635 [Burkholderiales bacterium]|jgi:hypothetical protein|nr:hypothetical protein [Burkholderiales bacterium]
MLTEARNASHYREWVEHIAHNETKDAFRYLVGLAAEDPRYNCYPMRKGEVLDFRFEDAHQEQPFSFITNKGSLLFCFRKPATQAGHWSKELLADHFDSVSENARGEVTVRLRSIADVQRLWRLIGPSTTPFRSGTTPTTQIGYINPNNQRCGGNRGVAGTDHLQLAYRMDCQVPDCGHVYGANGTDVFQRKCPYCQDGKPGIPF